MPVYSGDEDGGRGLMARDADTETEGSQDGKVQALSDRKFLYLAWFAHFYWQSLEDSF